MAFFQLEEQWTTSASMGRELCPDLIRLADVGEADGLRGKIVRLFFWALDKVS